MSQENLIIDAKNERYIQAGRICMVIYGKHYRKLVCVVDFIDRNRVLVDGAKGKLSTIKRSSYPIRRLQCTKFRLPVLRDVSQEDLVKAVEVSNVKDSWGKSAPGRRASCVRRLNKLNDFTRFKLYFIKGEFKRRVAKELLTLRAQKESADKTKKPITPAELRKREQVRLHIHPTLRRVTGAFKRKLENKVAVKQRRRKARLLKQGKNFGKLTKKRVKKMQDHKNPKQPQVQSEQPPTQEAH